MDCKKVGKLIYELRKEKNMTQKQVAELMNISDKTISKWERGLGCPDISLLLKLSDIFGVSIDGILSGEINLNELEGGNMKNIRFYICDKCGNLITTTGEASISCCGKKIEPSIAKKAEDGHRLNVENIENELFITSEHEMKKEHYISFVAHVKGDRVQIVKQYPEWNMQFRLNQNGRGKLYFYCKEHGLFYQIV
ncbi:helix-turn-helix domain-containing protein [Romboutsia sp. 1001216sp1]|uniref:helix-turn-helix domain-containing protein n=1 Tax=Romboutsia sp. 1001216sp1 TaxID=2986997 RepID=UPI00232C631D|nr:helix-turn-helix domain-containing protein [Romboutsia sp. 1001216sp1]MDB8805238.1 helix-turn-helix domain-containing protein [Romboutsia sp. 1001216sp1]MDB8807088.1 helix-turn-helix domain-containing protein [Romboutsia sp. 1001216sp1]MDB8810883.1 helix-turn-helix domain-containing protein [Romboutsia sp. 1001216sp1]MDB8816603.1 helix-turn-helix domain-containing protein [Romboutsia sp. 1001216sp1]MDB8819112.1 helix-turn-helix domain-containing protein [Romboutsia sp. 1001216sp1]